MTKSVEYTQRLSPDCSALSGWKGGVTCVHLWPPLMIYPQGLVVSYEPLLAGAGNCANIWSDRRRGARFGARGLGCVGAIIAQ